MNVNAFVRGNTVVAKIGTDTKLWSYFRITSRQGWWITLKPLTSVEVDGKWVPGEPDPAKKTIRRLVSNAYGGEQVGGLVVNGMALGLHLYRKAKGGKRTGAGRKPGVAKGRTMITRSIAMNKASWEKLDVLRGDQARGAFIAKALQLSE